MAFENCIAEIVGAGGGKVDEAEAEKILQRVFDRATRYQRKDGLGAAEAAVRAARELGDEGRIAAAYARRDAAINALRRDALDARVIPGQEAEAVRGLLSGVEGKGRSLAASIDAEAHATSGRLVGGLLADLRNEGVLPAVLRRNKTFEQDIGREMWRLEDPAAGAPTGNKLAEQVAEILHRWQETARLMENEVGARIGKLDHYTVRQSHDMEKIRRAGYETWRDAILPKLDEQTFEGRADREEFLKHVYANLASGNHETSQGAAGFLGPQNLGKKLSEERVLYFKDADSWLDYNEQFGRGNVVDSALRGLDMAGRNTALMRNLGTNPQAMFDGWVKTLADEARDRGDFATSDALRAGRNQKILNILTGKSELPENLTIAAWGRYIRQAETMAKLGGVVLSSLPDLAVNVATLRHSGVPLLEAWGNTALSPLLGRRGGATREIADLMDVGTDGMKSRLLSRFWSEDRFGTGGKLVETFHRMNFLSFWTDSLKTGAGLMLSYNLARNAGREFAALPRRLQTTLQRYGIEAGEWDALRQVEKRAADGRDYILPGDVQDLPDTAIAHLARTDSPAELGRIRNDLQAKLGSYITDTTREAMTEPTAAGRIMSAAGTPGTVGGEALRLLMQFKSYPMTFLQRSVMRELKRDGVDVAGIAHLVVATTLLGYASMTLKELAKGRNPRQPEDAGDYAKTAAAAMVQGGGLGIYGDFLFGEANRMGGGFIGSLAGPTAGTIEDVHKMMLALRDGSETKTRGQRFAAEAINTLKNNAPFMNLFYTRAALDHFVLHRLQEAVNPGYLRRYEEKIKKENAQTFWLRPTSSPY